MSRRSRQKCERRKRRERRERLRPPTGIDENATERACDQDRAYFQEHPGAGRYVREVAPGEFPVGSGATHVLVLEIAPGSRVRLAFTSRDGVPPGCVIRQADTLLAGLRG